MSKEPCTTFVPFFDRLFNLKNIPELQDAEIAKEIFPYTYYNRLLNKYFFCFIEKKDCPIRLFVSPNAELKVPKDFIRDHFSIRYIWMNSEENPYSLSRYRLFISTPFPRDYILGSRYELRKKEIAVDFRDISDVYSKKNTDENIFADWNNIGCKISLKLGLDYEVKKINIMLYDYSI